MTATSKKVFFSQNNIVKLLVSCLNMASNFKRSLVIILHGMQMVLSRL